MAERKAFNFYRSYFDVYMELSDKDKVKFMDALLIRQFTGVKPNLDGMSKFAYLSQSHSIDAQVTGFETKTGTKLVPIEGGTQGGSEGASGQEKGEEQEQGEEEEKEEVKDKSILLCSISDESELDEHEFITLSFWRLFKSNLEELNIEPTNLNKAKLENWKTPIRLALERDGRTQEEFRELFKFLQVNQFWKKNIQSTSKLREQFERLLVESRSKPEKKEDRNQLSPEYLERLNQKLNG